MSETLQQAEPGAATDASALETDYRRVRKQTEALCLPLHVEDMGVQPMPDASPPKWHLAHTTWFFETFLLKPGLPGYRAFNAQFEYLFNSYYNAVGDQFPRAERGNLSRPTVAEVMAYREHVDDAMLALLDRGDADGDALTLGLHHEQQHQELMLTDLKYNLGRNPLFPAYRSDLATAEPGAVEIPRFVEFDAADVAVGAEDDVFCFDNEQPRHRVHVLGFALADRVVTNDEYLAFIRDGGYRRPELWLSDAWSALQSGTRECPLYWFQRDGSWLEYTLGGLAPLNPAQPVTHVSFYEADAFARWSDARLPTEFEWERAAAGLPVEGNYVDSDFLTPRPARGGGLKQMFGDVWEWTSSSYRPYPGYRPLAGAFGEYNGKFMSGQMVLRGGSCATPADHIRRTYRNFFYPPDQWQFSGIRLARDLT